MKNLFLQKNGEKNGIKKEIFFFWHEKAAEKAKKMVSKYNFL